MGLERCIEKEEFDESSLFRETQHHLASSFTQMMRKSYGSEQILILLIDGSSGSFQRHYD
jgi:hypothetical protein